MGKIKLGVTYTSPALGAEIGPVSFAQKLEQWGFSSFWVVDTLSAPEWDPITMLAAVSQTTRRIELGTTVVALPFRSPIQLTKQALSVDQLSQGRLILGVGLGVLERDFEILQVDKAHRGKISDEALEIVHRLTTETNVTHRGPRWKFDAVTLEPRPTRSTGIPLWVGAIWKGGFADAVLRRVARHGDCFFPIESPPDGFVDAQKKIANYAESYRRNPEAIELAATMWLCLGSGREEAAGKATCEFGRRYGAGWYTINPAANLLGTVRECMDTIEQFAAAGVTHFALYLLSPPAEALEHCQAVAEGIIPRLS